MLSAVVLVVNLLRPGCLIPLEAVNWGDVDLGLFVGRAKKIVVKGE